MSAQESSVVTYPQHVSREESDFDVAEQLLQHSQGRRHDGFSATAGVSGQDPSPEFASNRYSMEDQREGEGSYEQVHGISPSQDRQTDAQYAPIDNSAMGQVCR